ncbi:ROK family transcriptional regulator [Nonomuraea sp. K274]|uniref:ROK family transcriptional regulator n=1 Tax=Nonomuraea cypriaca TaxID=1187855 RepID=A0A931A985_9ACTN|nr:ROK family transcriptional regulator [Nonomuraea cypriaca]MBF8186984.1 ROK family transcriptional regulator [Nonomuraea cypriaca]
MSSVRTEGMNERAAKPEKGRTGTRRPRPAQLGDIRQQNYSTIMRELMHAGPLARTDLATAIGMSTGAVTKLTAALARAGLLTRAPEAGPTGVGRPKVPVDIDESTYGVIGVHFGLHRTITCLINLKGRLVDEVHEPHGTTGFEPVVRGAAAAVERMAAAHRVGILGVGASTGGWVDSASGQVEHQPVLGWRDVPLAQELRGMLGLPVVIDSHVRALALAEHWFGAAMGVDNLIHLFVGNVVGAGFIFNGRPYPGARAVAGGLDHLPVAGASGEQCDCGSRSCFKMVAGDLEVARRAREAGLIADDGEIYDVLTLAAGGNGAAQALLRERAELVGRATATLIELLDPELVIVGGGVSAPADHVAAVRETARAKLDADRFRDAGSLIQASAFGPHAVGIAAGAVLLDAVYRSPEVFVPALAGHEAARAIG